MSLNIFVLLLQKLYIIDNILVEKANLHDEVKIRLFLGRLT